MARERTIKVSIDSIIGLSKVAQAVYAYALKNQKDGEVDIRPADLYKDLGYTNARMIYNGLGELTKGEKPLLTKVTGRAFGYKVNKQN